MLLKLVQYLYGIRWRL